MTDKILLVDGHSIINRAFYGLPDLTNSEGVHTGAVYGFLNILLRMLDPHNCCFTEFDQVEAYVMVEVPRT